MESKKDELRKLHIIAFQRKEPNSTYHLLSIPLSQLHLSFLNNNLVISFLSFLKKNTSCDKKIIDHKILVNLLTFKTNNVSIYIKRET